MRKFLSFASLFLLGATLSACATSPTLEQVANKKFLPLVDKSQPQKKPYQSILVGIVTPTETKIIPFGTLTDKGDIATPSTIFEIGSISKGFLGLSLAQESLNGALNLDEAYDKNTSITWRHLAQHTSGLPRMPTNLKPENPMQPYADYDEAKLKSFLKSFHPQNPPGTKSEYSNLGAGVAGHRLEKLHRKGLEEILRNDFLDGLSLKDTRITLNAEQASRMSPVFLNGEKSEPWLLRPTSVLKGAGSLRSTMQDMTTLLKTMMGLGEQKYLPMVSLATTPTFTSGKNSGIGLFWNHLTEENIVWHNGGTYGSSSFMGYDPDQMIGIVVLANSQFIDEKGVDPRIDIASITSLLTVAANQKMEKPLKILKDYDKEVARRISEFEKVPAKPQQMDWVQAKLAHMVDIDQYMRKLPSTINQSNLSPAEKALFDKGYWRRFYMMDWQNTQDLKALLKIHGWFNISKWGKQSDNQAWLLVQHADNDPKFQKEILEKLSKLYKEKETDPTNYAYLYDRVASPQRYGTQGKCTGPGQWQPHPIEDAENVDKLRAELGLKPMQEYQNDFKEICN